MQLQLGKACQFFRFSAVNHDEKEEEIKYLCVSYIPIKLCMSKYFHIPTTYLGTFMIRYLHYIFIFVQNIL
jgi:hypothetical protein